MARSSKFEAVFNEYAKASGVNNAPNSRETAVSGPVSMLGNPFKRSRVAETVSEVDRYLEDPYAKDVLDFDILAWWKAREAEYLAAKVQSDGGPTS